MLFVTISTVTLILFLTVAQNRMIDTGILLLLAAPTLIGLLTLDVIHILLETCMNIIEFLETSAKTYLEYIGTSIGVDFNVHQDQETEDQETEDQETEDQETEDQETEDQETEDQETEDQEPCPKRIKLSPAMEPSIQKYNTSFYE